MCTDNTSRVCKMDVKSRCAVIEAEVLEPQAAHIIQSPRVAAERDAMTA